jgi:tight adherence protein B
VTGTALCAGTLAGAASLLASTGHRRAAAVVLPAGRGSRTAATRQFAGRMHRWRRSGWSSIAQFPVRVRVVGVLVAAGLMTALSGVAAGIGVGLVVAAATRVAAEQRDERRADRRGELWQEALVRLAAALRAGSTVSGALRSAAEVDHDERAIGAAPGPGGQLRIAALHLDTGGSPATAFAAASDPVARRLAACFELCAVLGLAPVPVLADLVAAEVTAAAGRRETRIAFATARATSRLLAALPLGGMVLAALFGVSAPRFLLGTLGGQLCVLAAGLFEAAGLLWVQRLGRVVGDR